MTSLPAAWALETAPRWAAAAKAAEDLRKSRREALGLAAGSVMATFSGDSSGGGSMDRAGRGHDTPARRLTS